MAAPWSETALGHLPWLTGLSLCFSLILAFAALSAWRADRSCLRASMAALLWTLIAVIPVYGVLFVSSSLQGSRYLYLPAMGWSLAVGAILGSTTTAAPTTIQRAARLAAFGMLLPMLYATHVQQQDWRDAAALRDKIIADVKAEAPDCTADQVRVDNLPDSVRAAYLFRNGFKEALMEARGPLLGAIDGSARCHFTYTATGLVRKD